MLLWSQLGCSQYLRQKWSFCVRQRILNHHLESCFQDPARQGQGQPFKLPQNYDKPAHCDRDSYLTVDQSWSRLWSVCPTLMGCFFSFLATSGPIIKKNKTSAFRLGIYLPWYSWNVLRYHIARHLWNCLSLSQLNCIGIKLFPCKIHLTHPTAPLSFC